MKTIVTVRHCGETHTANSICSEVKEWEGCNQTSWGDGDIMALWQENMNNTVLYHKCRLPRTTQGGDQSLHGAVYIVRLIVKGCREAESFNNDSSVTHQLMFAN